MTSSAWTTRDLVTVLDVTGDGVADLVYRSDSSARLLLRTGVAASGGGVNIWTVHSTGQVRFYAGGKTALSSSGTEAIG
ncbi:hypothetical protein AQJ58_13995 [Streptomyces sp. DSM 15324]|nr:hypothetical protein AQJ58_13995 [Streptomyces sp. DSM 15324]